MRKNFLWFLLAGWTFVLFISCNNGQQTDFCQPVEKAGLILSSDWNDCYTVSRLFSWNISSDDWDASNRPFDTCIGMAIKVSGWIYNNPDGINHNMFYLTDNPIYARSDTFLPMPRDALIVKSSNSFPVGADISKKCFVSGRVSIFQLHTGAVLDCSDNPKACYVFIPNIIADSVNFAD